MTNKVSGDKQVIIKTKYFYPVTKQNAQGYRSKVAEDMLYYVIGDEHGNREIKTISKPQIEYYKAIVPQEYPRISIPRKDVRKIVCPYNERTKSAASEVGKLDEMWNSFKMKSHREFLQEEIHSHPDLYMVDMDIEDFCKTSFIRTHGNHVGKIPLRKSFMDIEVDVYNERHFDQKDALCPINVISYLDEYTNTIHEFLLRYDEKEIPAQRKMEEDPTQFITEVYEYFFKVQEDIKEAGGKVKKPLTFDIKLHFYDTELEVITAYFDMMNECAPDFCGIWNMNFDVVTILNRLKKLNVSEDEIAQIICSKDLPDAYKQIRYQEDSERRKEHSDTHYSRFFDMFHTATPYTIYDQMSLFSNLRKRFLEPTYKLDDIGEKYAKVKKVDLAAHNTNIAEASRDDYNLFLKYAIMDVVVQYSIEQSCDDINKYIMQSYNTRFSHGNKVSFLIKNLMGDFYHDKDEVIGNNVQYSIREKVPGAIIAKPELIRTKGRKILGNKSHSYKNIVDLDISSEYPSILITFNVLKSSIYGRITEVVLEPEEIGAPDILLSDGTTLGIMLQTIDTSIFDMGEKYYGLPSYENIVSGIENQIKANSPYLHDKK